MTYFNSAYFLNCFTKLLPYLPLTVLILLISVAISLPLAMLLAWRQMSGRVFERGLIRVYIQIIRGAPFIVMLFIIYFGLPKLLGALFGVDAGGWTKSVYIILTLVLFQSARMCEAMRSAYLAVPVGQREAGLSCGLSPFQVFCRIMFPQAALIVLPNLGNLLLSSLLETALGFSIGLIDFVGNARLMAAREYGLHTLEIYIAVALTYWLLAVLLARLFSLVEGRLSRHQGRAPARRVGKRRDSARV